MGGEELLEPFIGDPGPDGLSQAIQNAADAADAETAATDDDEGDVVDEAEDDKRRKQWIAGAAATFVVALSRAATSSP